MHIPQQVQVARKQIVFATRCAFAAFASCALFTISGLLSAQTGGTSAISGAITDPMGAMVPGAQVKVTDVATGSTRTSLSDQSDVDLSLSKTFLIRWPREDAGLEFRSDFFNALNHPNFAGPNNEASSTTFGKITATSTNPGVIQLALKYSF
jgi:hypothetical protein